MRRCFRRLVFSISKDLGGEEGLRDLIAAAKKKYGIELIVDLIPHMNQNAHELPEWAFVKARGSDGNIIRRLATDGSVNHEDGSPVEWHDSVMLNWRDARVLEAYKALLQRLATMGIAGVRIDVAHHFGVMLPGEASMQSRQKLFGHITNWERNEQGGFRVVNSWDHSDANPLLLYLVSEINRQHSDFIFLGENYGKDLHLINSGVIPMDAGTYSDLQKVIIDGESARDVLNGHFRWLFWRASEKCPAHQRAGDARFLPRNGSLATLWAGPPQGSHCELVGHNQRPYSHLQPSGSRRGASYPHR